MTRLLLRDACVAVASASSPTNQSRKITCEHFRGVCYKMNSTVYDCIFSKRFFGICLTRNAFQTEKTNIYLALPHYTAKCILQTFYYCVLHVILYDVRLENYIYDFTAKLLIKSMSYYFSYELIRRFKILKSGNFLINREKYNFICF